MTRLKQLQRCAAFAGSFLLAAAGAQAAGNFTVQNGTWVVTSEVDGKPGRGMAIDAQDGMLVLAVYNYESSGQPSFHLASGAMTGNHFSGSLTRYRNGRYFGSGPLDAQEDGDAGTVQIDFDSGSTGTIRFPGEAPVAISRFNFDAIPSGQLSRPTITEQWLMAELNADGKPVNALLIRTGAMGISPGPGYLPQVLTAQSFTDGTAPSTACSYSSATQLFSCNFQFSNTPGTRTLQWSKHLESMSGTISGADGTCNYSPCVPVTRRVVGMRLGIDYSAVAVNAQMDAPSSAMTLPAYKLTPDPGMWVVSNELATGKPGRGMSIDVQHDNSVMLTYNYEKSGAPTFHMGISAYTDNKATAHLIRYEGGRYFGGPALSAHEVADAGEVKLEFITPTLGNIQFPGEAPVAIERFQFGATKPSPESLFGGWMIFDPAKKQLKYYELSTTWSTAPDEATGTGALLSIRCKYLGDPLTEAVRCRDQTPVSIDDYLFTPVNGRAIGSHETSGTSTATGVYVLRVKDRNGNLAGLGKF